MAAVDYLERSAALMPYKNGSDLMLSCRAWSRNALLWPMLANESKIIIGGRRHGYCFSTLNYKVSTLPPLVVAGIPARPVPVSGCGSDMRCCLLNPLSVGRRKIF
jgi:hypothetical protein